MKDVYNLQRFVDAQAGVYEGACAELRRGRKTGHWMWFIFPHQGIRIVRGGSITGNNISRSEFDPYVKCIKQIVSGNIPSGGAVDRMQPDLRSSKGCSFKGNIRQSRRYEVCILDDAVCACCAREFDLHRGDR